MCQRYVLSDQSATEREFLPDTAWWRFDVRYNVAVGQNVPAIRLHDAGSEGVMLRWGLIPAWSELPPSEPARASVHLARIERSKSFAEPWNSGRRCILPMAGFYLWQLTAAGHRQPYFVHLNNRALFGVAGLWDRWEADDGDVIESCSMIAFHPTTRVGARGPGQWHAGDTAAQRLHGLVAGHSCCRRRAARALRRGLDAGLSDQPVGSTPYASTTPHSSSALVEDARASVAVEFRHRCR